MIIQALLFVVKADMNLFLMQQLAVGDIPEPTFLIKKARYRFVRARHDSS